jgi:hypothetical protein
MADIDGVKRAIEVLEDYRERHIAAFGGENRVDAKWARGVLHGLDGAILRLQDLGTELLKLEEEKKEKTRAGEELLKEKGAVLEAELQAVRKERDALMRRQ